MDTLTNKKFAQFDYLSRYTSRPYYYDVTFDREIFGLGSNLKQDTPWVAHKVKAEDTLDSLALTYYNNPTFWWMIAYFNNIQDPFIDIYKTYTILKIPSMSGIEFGNERQ